MIYCVEFDDVVAHLHDIGFREIGRSDDFVAFERRDGSRLTLRPPNVDGDLPEILANDAFATAGLSVPNWTVFWCD